MAKNETLINELKINYLTQELYDQAFASGQINDNEIYMTPSSIEDLAVMYATKDELNGKSDKNHSHTIEDISNLQNSLDEKQDIISGAASTITSDDLTVNKVLVSNSSGKVTTSAITNQELGCLSGIESAIQDQLDNKQGTITGAASTIASSNLTASRALASNASGKVVATSVTSTELGYLDGVTSAIQDQLNNKQASITGGASTIASSNLTTNRALISNGSGKVAVSDITSEELGYLDGVSDNIQNQLDGKLSLSGGTMTGSIIMPKNDNMGIIPDTNNYGQIGSSDKKFYRMYASTFNGNLKGDVTGNADTATSATKATQDGNGNTITSTYATKSELNSKLNAPSSTGIAGQFAVSDGNGGISWLTVTNVSEVGM